MLGGYPSNLALLADCGELRLVSKAPAAAFTEAKEALMRFFADNVVKASDIRLSGELPRADPVSVKFKHILKQSG